MCNAYTPYGEYMLRCIFLATSSIHYDIEKLHEGDIKYVIKKSKLIHYHKLS